ncbi:hypothetical protein CVT26_005939 [Gymnopilus dilepis]|uniref:Uncharacterized protein n=1 Tax=Gymnopilus dilepis TaxID=231916 RepID=A0A409Y1Q2_9AGAR|nr:hypothetical protein CVT26_005939 [Gymnopilus dilepis]
MGTDQGRSPMSQSPGSSQNSVDQIDQKTPEYDPEEKQTLRAHQEIEIGIPARAKSTVASHSKSIPEKTGHSVRSGISSDKARKRDVRSESPAGRLCSFLGR